jgi:hypothetical protein
MRGFNFVNPVNNRTTDPDYVTLYDMLDKLPNPPSGDQSPKIQTKLPFGTPKTFYIGGTGSKKSYGSTISEIEELNKALNSYDQKENYKKLINYTKKPCYYYIDPPTGEKTRIPCSLANVLKKAYDISGDPQYDNMVVIKKVKGSKVKGSKVKVQKEEVSDDSSGNGDSSSDSKHIHVKELKEELENDYHDMKKKYEDYNKIINDRIEILENATILFNLENLNTFYEKFNKYKLNFESEMEKYKKRYRKIHNIEYLEDLRTIDDQIGDIRSNMFNTIKLIAKIDSNLKDKLEEIYEINDSPDTRKIISYYLKNNYNIIKNPQRKRKNVGKANKEKIEKIIKEFDNIEKFNHNIDDFKERLHKLYNYNHLEIYYKLLNNDIVVNYTQNCNNMLLKWKPELTDKKSISPTIFEYIDIDMPKCRQSMEEITNIVSRINPLVNKLLEYHEKIGDLQRNYEKILDKRELVLKNLDLRGYMWWNEMHDVKGKKNLKNFIDKYSKTISSKRPETYKLYKKAILLKKEFDEITNKMNEKENELQNIFSELN